MEQAYRAIVISQSLEHIMEQRRISTYQALAYLTKHIGKINVTSKPSDPVVEKDPTIEHPVRIILPDQSTSKPKSTSTIPTILHVGKKDKTYVASTKSTKLDSQKRDRSDSVPDEVVAKLGESISTIKSGNSINVKNPKQSEAVAPPNNNVSHTKANVTPATGRTKRNRGAGEENEMLSINRSSKRSRMNST
jgi:hypothetical protein